MPFAQLPAWISQGMRGQVVEQGVKQLSRMPNRGWVLVTSMRTPVDPRIAVETSQSVPTVSVVPEGVV